MVRVTYLDGTDKNYDTFNDIEDNDSAIEINCSFSGLKKLPKNMNFPNLQTFSCHNNKLTKLPENMNFPNLQTFSCHNNKLTKLLENMNFPNLQTFSCHNNKLTKLSDNMNFPYLKIFDCHWNDLTKLPDNMNFPNLQYLNCSWNNLIELPNNMNFPNLQKFCCYHNQLTKLPDNMNFPNMLEFYCSSNQLTSLPLCIMNWNRLTYIDYTNNPIELSPQMARFFNRIRQGSTNKLNVYNDGQNVHNSSIQLSVKNSINNITTRTDLPKYNKDELITMIINDDTFTCKEQLIEYCNDESVHSLLLLTFSEVLWFVLQTIESDFDKETQKEIKCILNQEMRDAECKCFTGRMNRVINCLNGFSKYVEINIQDSEQIGNIVYLVKERLGSDYTVEKHRDEVKKELNERGYDDGVIEEWIGYIE